MTIRLESKLTSRANLGAAFEATRAAPPYFKKKNALARTSAVATEICSDGAAPYGCCPSRATAVSGSSEAIAGARSERGEKKNGEKLASVLFFR